MTPFDGIADPDYYARQAAKALRRGFRAGAAAAEDGAVAESVPVAATFAAIMWLFQHFAKWVEKELKGKGKDPGSPGDDQDDPSHPMAVEDYSGMAEPFRGSVPNTMRSAARIAHKSVPLAAHHEHHKYLTHKARQVVLDSARKRKGRRPDFDPLNQRYSRRRLAYEGISDMARGVYDNRREIQNIYDFIRDQHF